MLVYLADAGQGIGVGPGVTAVQVGAAGKAVGRWLGKDHCQGSGAPEGCWLVAGGWTGEGLCTWK